MTSTTKQRWWLAAVLARASIASVIRCNAVSAPIVMSVPAKSFVDRADETDEGKARVLLGYLRRYSTLVDEFRNESTPLAAENVGPRQASVSTNDDQTVDPLEDEVLGRQEPPLSRPESLTPRGTDARTALLENSPDRTPRHLPDPVATVDESLKARFGHGIHLGAAVQGRSHGRATPGASPPLVRIASRLTGSSLDIAFDSLRGPLSRGPGWSQLGMIKGWYSSGTLHGNPMSPPAGRLRSGGAPGRDGAEAHGYGVCKSDTTILMPSM